LDIRHHHDGYLSYLGPHYYYYGYGYLSLGFQSSPQQVHHMVGSAPFKKENATIVAMVAVVGTSITAISMCVDEQPSFGVVLCKFYQQQQ